MSDHSLPRSPNPTPTPPQFLRATKTPHILLLDEPTNHLDIETIDSLADAIKRFEGGVVLVSHDMRLIDQVAKEIWECDKGTITRVQGDIAAYKRMLQKKLEAAADRFERDRRSGGSAGGGLSEPAPAPAPAPSAKVKGRSAAPVAPPPASLRVAPPPPPPPPLRRRRAFCCLLPQPRRRPRLRPPPLRQGHRKSTVSSFRQVLCVSQGSAVQVVGASAKQLRRRLRRRRLGPVVACRQLMGLQAMAVRGK